MAKCTKCGTKVATPRKTWKMAGRPDKSGNHHIPHAHGTMHTEGNLKLDSTVNIIARKKVLRPVEMGWEVVKELQDGKFIVRVTNNHFKRVQLR